MLQESNRIEFKVNDENFEIVTKMRELKDYIEEIKVQCK